MISLNRKNDGSIAGIIREVSGSGMLIEDARGQLQAVNLEYVTRINFVFEYSASVSYFMHLFYHCTLFSQEV